MLRQHFKESVIVRLSPEDVFHYAAAEYFLHRKAIHKSIIESEQTSKGPMRVGTTGRDLAVDAWGRYIESIGIVTEYEPNRRFAIESISRFSEHQPEARVPVDASAPPTHSHGRFTFEAIPQGTRTTLETIYESPVGGIFARLYHLTSRGRVIEQYREWVYVWKESIEAEAGLAPEKPPFRLRLKRLWFAWVLFALAFLTLFWLYVSRDVLQLAPPAVRAVQIGITAMCALFVGSIFLNMILKKSGY